MYQITVEDHFDAAHGLRGYKGKCETIHGHRFKVAVKITAFELDEIGMAYDFTMLKQKLGEILSRFDHTTLNDIPPFDEINPSSENIAVTVYNELKPKLADTPAFLTSAEVWESPNQGVVYTPD